MFRGGRKSHTGYCESMANKKNGSYIFDLNSSRILAHLDRARAAYEGKMPYPSMAIIYPTYRCNCNCVGCEYKPMRKKSGADFEPRELLKTLAELRGLGVSSVEFSGGGEPSLYPHIALAIKTGKELGMTVGMLTNGSNIRGEIAETVVENLSYIRVSLDAATDITYKRVRKSAADGFRRVMRNLDEIVSRREVSGTHLLIGIKFLVSRHNCHEIFDVYRLAKETGVDSIQYKALRQSSGEATPDQLKVVSEQIAELKESKWPRATGGVERAVSRRRCRLTPLQTTIDPYGSVFLCNYFLHRRSRHCIGSIHDNTFEEIWKSRTHEELLTGIRPPECNLYDCRFIKYAEIIGPIVKDPCRQLDFV